MVCDTQITQGCM